MQARSPLRLRLGLAVFGLMCALGATAGFASAQEPGLAGLFGAIALVAMVDLVVVAYRFHQGSRYQPGRDVPPYWPRGNRRRRRR